jgi:hypothetical protein
MKKTTYQLTHRITGKPLMIPQVFRSATEAAFFAIVHDLHANVSLLGEGGEQPPPTP